MESLQLFMWQFKEFASENKEIVTVAGIALAILFVVSIAKRAVKLAVALIIICAVMGVSPRMIGDISDKYSFNIDGDIINIKIDGKEYSFDKSAIAGGFVMEEDEAGLHVRIPVNGSGTDTGEVEISAPKGAKMIVEKFLGELEKYTIY